MVSLPYKIRALAHTLTFCGAKYFTFAAGKNFIASTASYLLFSPVVLNYTYI